MESQWPGIGGSLVSERDAPITMLHTVDSLLRVMNCAMAYIREAKMVGGASQKYQCGLLGI